jgi:hypothetical protein
MIVDSDGAKKHGPRAHMWVVYVHMHPHTHMKVDTHSAYTCAHGQSNSFGTVRSQQCLAGRTGGWVALGVGTGTPISQRSGLYSFHKCSLYAYPMPEHVLGAGIHW